MDSPPPDDSLDNEIPYSYRHLWLFCGICGDDLVVSQNDGNLVHAQNWHHSSCKEPMQHTCMARPAPIKPILKCIVKGMNDAVFAADRIDEAANKLWLYWQEELAKLRELGFYHRGEMEELSDDHQELSDRKEAEEESDALSKLDSVRKKYLDDYVSAKMSRADNDRLRSRYWPDMAEIITNGIYGVNYHFNEYNWTQEQISRYLRTGVVPEDKQEELLLFAFADFVHIILDRVNVFDDHIDMIFHSAGKHAEHGEDDLIADKRLKQVPLPKVE